MERREMRVGRRGSGEKGLLLLLLLLLLLSHKYFASSSEDVQALYAVPTCLEYSVEMRWQNVNAVEI